MITFEEWWDEVGHNMWCDDDDVFLSDVVKAAWDASYIVGINDVPIAEYEPPEGYVLVPVEPTEKMLKVGEELEYFEGGYGSTCDEFYKAMIQAALEEQGK